MANPVVIGNAELWLGDCREILPTLPKVDAVVTDPPYSSGGMVRGDRNAATSSKYQHGDTPVKHPEFSGDSRDQRGFLAWCSLWMGEARQLVPAGAPLVTFTDWRQLPTTTDAIQAGGWVWRGIATWDKGTAIPQPNSFLAQCEFIAWATNGPRVTDYKDGAYLPGCFRVNAPKTREHITEKPVELMSELVQIVPVGSVVLDPFMGSGTTGVSCSKNGRQFVGIEMSPRYFDIACERIENAQRQARMFA